MTDFSEPYRNVPFWGVWADESADVPGCRDAVLVLAGAVERCADEDMRADAELAAALAYLSRQGHAKRTAIYRRALDVHDPEGRRQAAFDALTAIRRDAVAYLFSPSTIMKPS